MKSVIIFICALIAVQGASAPKDCSPGHTKGMNGPAQHKV